MNVTGTSGALSAIQRQLQVMDQAAARVARAGLQDAGDPTETSTSVAASAEDDFISGTVDGLVAQRMFTAAVRLAETTNENIIAVLRLGGYMAEQTT
ncbi:MAG: hypothetical protein ABI877_06400 [Gemmatimonadaceae bacterium]